MVPGVSPEIDLNTDVTVSGVLVEIGELVGFDTVVQLAKLPPEA
ncbi:unannotated protein [freshwater metagenome]|uniref:Unannotated protein n=1 Tax=freshwater metagenome TaxID=449393 RepID=A0A6J5ZK54_9ZZZZ